MGLLEQIQTRLESGALRDNLAPLFYDTLGWGAGRSPRRPVTVDGQTLVLTPLAELGGLPVFHAAMPNDAKLPGITYRRAVHKALAPTAQEHLLVYTTADQKQAQFVSARNVAGGKTELRTLPYTAGHPGRTTVERLAELYFSAPELGPNGDVLITQVMDRVDRAFSVRAVTDQFFKDYKKTFDQVIDMIQGVQGDKRLYTQRLMNRLMFLQFLARKGWMEFGGSTDYLAALWKGRDQTQHFWEAHVVPLFFAGLNNPQALDLNKNNPVLFSRIGKVPYLNGGLFEQAQYESEHNIPGDCAGEQIADEAFDLIINDLFSHYNFTIHESTPLDVEVAVDPEMLGNVFEKLMNDRKVKAAYYTPRTIVAFMCREALKGFLGKTSADTPGTLIPEERIARLVDGGDDTAVSLSEAKRLLARLTLLKVVDPACGSGAYLLGMMQELFTLTRLLDTRAENMQARDDYGRKLSIIQNNLYGVDLDLFAINVSMLRLWLSLIVDYREELSALLPPLPNLDFKIECGDSLLAPDPHYFGDMFRQELIEKADALNVKKAEFLSATGARKAQLREQIRASQDQLTRALRENGGATPRDLFEWRVNFAEVFKPTVADTTLGGVMNFGQELAEADVPGGFHIVIANPPYGVKVDDSLRKAYFPDASQSKDTYGLFMARAVQLLCEGGEFCYIVSDTWRTIKSHRPLRAFLLRETEIKHLIDLPDWVFEATVNTGIVTLTKQRPAPNHTLIAGDLHGLDRNDWNGLESNLNIIAARGVDVQAPRYARYTYPQSHISTYDNLSFFIASPKLYGLMSDPRFVKLETIADIKVGLQTGDNEYYLRKREGVRGSYTLLNEAELLTDAEVTGLTDDEKQNGVAPMRYGGRYYVPYDKGGESDSDDGWLPNYCVPTGYFINWSRDAVHRLRTATIADAKRRKGEVDQIRPGDGTTRAAVIRNLQFYFRPGLTFSRTGIYAPTYRMNSASVFDTEGSSLFTDKMSPPALLAIVASVFVRYLIKSIIDHSVHAQVDDLKEIVVPRSLNGFALQLEELVSSIIEKQKADLRYRYHLHEQREIDALVAELYGLDENDRREVVFWYCRRYPKLAQAQGVWDEVHAQYADYLERAALLLAKPPGYWRSHPVYERVAEGEGHDLDFKRFLGVDIHGAKSEKSIESVLKEIAGFLNADGGTLLIGVADSGQVVGIAPDLEHVTHKNTDGFELRLRQLVETHISPNPHGLVSIGFETLPDGEVCVVDIAPAPGVTYYKEVVYLRDGNRSVPLEGRRLVEWLQRRK